MSAFCFHRVARSSSHRAGCRSGRGLGLDSRSRLSRFYLDDIDAAFEIRAVFNDDARSSDIAHEFGILSDFQAVVRLYISPVSEPSATTSRALIPACTLPFGPIVSLCSSNSMVPRQSPLHVQIFLTVDLSNDFTALPIVAEPCVSDSTLPMAMLDKGVASFLTSTGLGAAGAGLGLDGGGGGSSSSRRLPHILMMTASQK